MIKTYIYKLFTMTSIDIEIANFLRTDQKIQQKINRYAQNFAEKKRKPTQTENLPKIDDRFVRAHAAIGGSIVCLELSITLI